MKLISRIVSTLFHPYIIPLYGCGISITNSYLIALPSIISLYFIVIVFFFTCLLPFLSHLILKLLYKDNKEQDFVKKTELILYSISLMLCAIFMHRIHAPIWTQTYMSGASLAATIVWISKICKYTFSSHTTAIGALWGLIYLIPQTSAPIALESIITLILITGSTATARQILEKENIIQLFLGLLCGIISPIILQKILPLSLFSTI